MKVRLVKRQTLIDFIAKNSQSEAGLNHWIAKLEYADWSNTNDIRATFNSVDFLGKSSNRVIFDIGGNKYRMICTYHFGKANIHLFIKWIGTHAKYDKLCKDGKQYTIKKY